MVSEEIQSKKGVNAMTDIEQKEAIDEIREALQIGKEWYEQGHEDLGENNNGDMTFDNALDDLSRLEASIKQTAKKTTVLEIVTDYLREHGYDGLCGDECGCGLDNFCLCGSLGMDCEPAYKQKPEDTPSDYDEFYSTVKPRINDKGEGK
jgi:hypothetical protein